MNARLARRAQAVVGVTNPGPALAWGDGGDGQLGNGTTKIADDPVQVSLPQGVTLSDVAAGNNFALGVTSTGGVLAWGDNGAGELGDGSTTSSNTPVQVQLPQGVTVTQVAAGQAFSLALTSGGQVYAWGDNGFGELGNGSSQAYADAPVQVSLPSGTTVTQVSAGGGFALALTSSGQVLAWGENNFGQLGNGSTSNQSTPVPVSLAPGTSVSQVSAGRTSRWR